MYGIHILKNNNEWFKIANVNDNIKLNIDSDTQVGKLMHKVCSSIVTMENNKFSDNKIISVGCKDNIQDEYILFGFVNDLRYRRGTIYYGFQYAQGTQKIRLLIFATDKIHHSAQCFGTNPLTLEISSIINDIKNEINDNVDGTGFTNDIFQNVKNSQYIIGI
jgi:hypothetical protein